MSADAGMGDASPFGRDREGKGEEEEEEDCSWVGDARENETVGAARGGRRKERDEQEQTDTVEGTLTETKTVAAVKQRGHGAQLRDRRRLSWRPSGGIGNGEFAAAAATASSCTFRSGPRERRARYSGILGTSVSWGSEDCDYDDSDDESYAPSVPRNSRAGAGAGAPSTSSSRRGEPIAASAATPRARKGTGPEGRKQGEAGIDLIASLSTEVVLHGIVRPYLSSASKCKLQRTCKEMRRLLDTPEAWKVLDLRAEVIGRRTMKSGRQSIMNKQPLFFLARSVVQQPRFALLRIADCRGLNLGAMGSTPALLVTLFNNCKQITTLDLRKTYVEDERLPQPDSSVEKVIAEHLPGVQHLALDMDTSNRGLKVLLEGCKSIKSLHIGSRCNRRGDCKSMYPSDIGMKAFTTAGAPYLETLSLTDKVNIGAAGLRCVLEASSCPRLKALILIRTGRVINHCLKAIAPDMGRLTSLTLDQCPVTPPTVKVVMEKCSELSKLVVSTQHGLFDHPKDGRVLLEFLVAQGPTKLSKFIVQRVDPPRDSTGFVPRWLLQEKNSSLCARVTTDERFVFGPASSADERIAPFMAGRDVY